jgi:hypothetical protein
MLLVYNDHTPEDPNPVRIGDEVVLPDHGAAVVDSIDPILKKATLRVLGQNFKTVAPLHILHARWVDAPAQASAEPTLEQLYENLAAAHRAYFEALRRHIPKEIV